LANRLGLGRLVSLRQSRYIYSCLAHKCAGRIYLAYDIFSGQDVIMKLEPTKGEHRRALAHEFRVYEKLGGGPGIPRVHWFGTEAGFDAMAIDRLGQSLEDLFVRCEFRFSNKTVSLLARQLVSGLDSLSYI
jgi:serine/threonine protein kinase